MAMPNFHDGKSMQDSHKPSSHLEHSRRATEYSSLKNSNLTGTVSHKVVGCFGVTPAIRLFSDSGCVHVLFLNVLATIVLTPKPDGVNSRSWFVNPMPEGVLFRVIFFAIVPPVAVCTVLGFFDQMSWSSSEKYESI